MLSRTTGGFRAQLAALPKPVREKANSAYALWKANPGHPSLRFKKVHATLPIFSVRVDRDYRAVGVVRGDAMVWFWSVHMQRTSSYFVSCKLRPQPCVQGDAPRKDSYSTPIVTFPQNRSTVKRLFASRSQSPRETRRSRSTSRKARLHISSRGRETFGLCQSRQAKGFNSSTPSRNRRVSCTEDLQRS